MLKRYKGSIICFYVLTAATLILATFYDLALDIRLNNPENLFALWLRNTGEVPSRLICPLAGTVLFFAAANRWEKTAGFLFALGGSAYLGYYFGKYFFLEENRMPFSILWGIGFGVVALLIGSMIPHQLMKKLKAAAWIGIIAMFAQLLCVECIKYLWGRVRFRDLLAVGNYDAFTPWFHPNGINGNKSFPSGHTAGAGMSYLMMLLPFCTDRFKGKEKLCFLLPFAYTSLVAFSRLIMGAHYLSDVAVGGAISFTIVLIALKIYEKHFSSSRPSRLDPWPDKPSNSKKGCCSVML